MTGSIAFLLTLLFWAFQNICLFAVHFSHIYFLIMLCCIHNCCMSGLLTKYSSHFTFLCFYLCKCMYCIQTNRSEFESCSKFSLFILDLLRFYINPLVFFIKKTLFSMVSILSVNTMKINTTFHCISLRLVSFKINSLIFFAFTWQVMTSLLSSTCQRATR